MQVLGYTLTQISIVAGKTELSSGFRMLDLI